MYIYIESIYIVYIYRNIYTEIYTYIYIFRNK